ncbi:hypothetical protein YC2023_103116 [Brassica napus]
MGFRHTWSQLAVTALPCLLIHTHQTNHSKLNSATHGPPGIYALMLSLIHLDEMRFCLVSVILWLQHGNVERWSQCVNSKTGFPSSLFGFFSQVKEIKSPWPVLASNTLMESAIASTAPLSSPPTNLLSGMPDGTRSFLDLISIFFTIKPPCFSINSRKIM